MSDKLVCVYHHAQRMLSFLHHGDDSVIWVTWSETRWLKGIIGARLIFTDRGSLGPRDTDLKEIRILHRTVKWFGPDDPKWRGNHLRSTPETCRNLEATTWLCWEPREGRGDVWRLSEGDTGLVEGFAKRGCHHESRVLGPGPARHSVCMQ